MLVRLHSYNNIKKILDTPLENERAIHNRICFFRSKSAYI